MKYTEDNKHFECNQDYDGIIWFDNGYKIISIHKQSCCEIVYADFKSLEDCSFLNEEFKELILESCEYGFRINNYFVPCYDIQNGYYSNNLTIMLLDENDNIIQSINDTGFTYNNEQDKR
jgi:hypothetical protein